MKQIYRDLLFLSLVPVTFLILYFEPKIHLLGWEHKLIEMAFILVLYFVVWLWVRFDVKETDRNLTRDYTINIYNPGSNDENK